MFSNASYPPSYSRHADVRITLDSKSAIPSCPVELKEIMSDEESQSRIMKVRETVGVNWSVSHRVFLVVATFFTVVAPMVVSLVLSHSLYNAASSTIETDDIATFEAQRRALLVARSIGIATFIGLGMVLWLPYFFFTRRVNRRIAILLTSYSTTREGPLLFWSLSSTSTWGQSAIVSIILPSRIQPTNFHPLAYLPDYMFKPEEGPAEEHEAVVPVGEAVGVDWDDAKV